MNIKIIALFALMPLLAIARPRTKNAAQMHPPVFLASIPKAGTHLISGCLGLMHHGHLRYPLRSFFNATEPDFNRNNGIFSHAPYNPTLAALIENHNYKGIFMIRDPRDQAISFIHFAQKNKIWPTIKSLSFQDALTRWISDAKVINSSGKFNDPSLNDLETIADFYNRYLPWIDHPNFYTVRFENLIGAKGGGSDELQRQEIINIAHHLEIEPTDALISNVISNLFGKSRTFRKGQIGSWKEQFTQEQKELFKEVAGDLLIYLGYEQDYNW